MDKIPRAARCMPKKKPGVAYTCNCGFTTFNKPAYQDHFSTSTTHLDYKNRLGEWLEGHEAPEEIIRAVLTKITRTMHGKAKERNPGDVGTLAL